MLLSLGKDPFFIEILSTGAVEYSDFTLAEF